MKLEGFGAGRSKNCLGGLDRLAKGMIGGKVLSEGEFGSSFIFSDSVGPS